MSEKPNLDCCYYCHTPRLEMWHHDIPCCPAQFMFQVWADRSLARIRKELGQ